MILDLSYNLQSASTSTKAMKNASFPTLLMLLLVGRTLAEQLPVSHIQTGNYTAGQISAAIALASNGTTMQLGNSQNVLYYINLNVGTPAQTLGVQFDTGSNILWLPTQQTGLKPCFNTLNSSTFTNTSTQGSVQYADGSGVAGTLGTDILSITGTPINITAQFLWVTQDSGMGFPPQVAGLVGMGYTSIPNFLDVAYQQGQISSPAFALQIMNSSNQSLMYYNQIPQWITNSTISLDVVGNTYWQVNVLGAIVGGIDMTSSCANAAVIDSGTSYFYLNAELFNRVVANFFQNCNNNISPPQCLCSSTPSWPTFSFLFEGMQMYIHPSQYARPVPFTNGICTYDFGTLSDVGSILLLGDIFFQQYIVTFNKLTSQVGFKGNFGPMQNVIPQGGQLYGYVSMGIISLAILIGIGTFCALEKYVPRKALSIDITNLQTLEMQDISPNLVVTLPKSYRIKQPIL